MPPRTIKPAAEAEPGSDPALDVDLGPETTPASDSAPISPPDRNGDGAPGGSDALEPCAVLLAPRGPLAAGLIVCGPRPAIAAMVDASAARMATPTDLAIAGGITRPLPTET